MITLEEIYARLKKKSDSEEESENETNDTTDGWHPIVTDDYVVPCFNIKGKGGGKPNRNSLSKILTFIDRVEHIRASSGCTIMPISTRSAANQQIWGNTKNVANAIEQMVLIGLISCEDSSYRFTRFKGESRSRTFRYYKENEDKIKEYCERNGIRKTVIENYNKHIKKVRTLSIRVEDVAFSSNLHLVKPDDCSISEFEDFLEVCLRINYPELTLHQHIADDINRMYYAQFPEFQIRFIPNFTWSSDNKYVRKIGIRATNALCGVHRTDRPEKTMKYGFTVEKDVTSSVPRITWSLNHGAWLDEDTDVYELIFRELGRSDPFTSESRDALKKLHMSAYFDSSEKNLTHHTWLKMDQTNIQENDIRSALSELRGAVIRAEGGRLYGNEIFLIESCIYLNTLYDLLSAGYKVWLLYDCFYSDDGRNEIDFESLVRDGVRRNFMNYYRDFFKKRLDRKLV